MRALGLFIGLILISTTSFAELRSSVPAPHSTTTCYVHEEDQRTHQLFDSREEYASELDRWGHVSRPSVGPIDLFLAYRTYRSERAYAETLAIDKAKHCYIGCVIGIATSAKVADYVGWLKEFQDLTDCDPTTHFEDADSVATSRGARLGARDRSECSTLCVEEFDSTPRPASAR